MNRRAGGQAGVPLGAHVLSNSRCEFRVWAPFHDRVEVHIVAPNDRRVTLTKTDDGYHQAIVDDVAPGAHYLFALGDRELPDPASRLQSRGVHGLSEVVASDFDWHDDAWRGLDLRDYVIYETHVGMFTEAGTFEAMIDRLDELKDLGITAIELFP